MTGPYTVGQIARAMGISRQAVYTGLAQAEPGKADGVDRELLAWSWESLPIEWRLGITKRGVMRNFIDGEAYMASIPSTPWSPPIAWEQLSDNEHTKAELLQGAISRALSLRTAGASNADVEKVGAEDFKAQFGYAISARHWRRLYQRTIDRDGGEENWQRKELYLGDRAFRQTAKPPAVLRRQYAHRELDEIFTAIGDRLNPSPEDRQFLWDAIFEHFERCCGEVAGSRDLVREQREIKSSLICYVYAAFPAGTLCGTLASLRRRFDEKHQQWIAGGRCPQAIQDHRAEKSGKFGRRLCEQCRPIVIGAAVDLDGDLSQAWRRLQLTGKLCGNCASIGAFDVRRNKSEVPKSVRANVTPDILAALPHRRGPKHARLISPYVLRRWDDIGPGDWAECDDMTPNHVTHSAVDVLTWDNDFDGRPYLGRMEVLVQIDRRTDYPWAYLIILGDPATIFSPQRKASYSSVHCRLLFLRAHDQLGLPHKDGGYLLENGIWASRLIDGPRLQHWDTNPWQRTEMSLKDPRIGLTVRHTLPGNPRSKVIERMFLAVQNRSRCQAGFIGFNERQDKRELMQDFINRVKAGKEHPGNQILQVSQFRQLMDEELMAHANEPQNGQRLPGVSPLEAFHNGIGGHRGIKDRPLRQLGEYGRFLLSSHERLLPVTKQGISFQIGSTPFVFWGPELEPFQNRQIIARFNFEEPDVLACQPPEGDPFTVKARILPSTTATKEELQEASRSRASWMRRGKVIYDSLPHPLRISVTLDNEQTQETREFGRFHNDEIRKAKDERTKSTRKLSRLRERAAAEGIPVSPNVRSPERVSAGIDLIREARERILEEECLNPTEDGND